MQKVRFSCTSAGTDLCLGQGRDQRGARPVKEQVRPIRHFRSGAGASNRFFDAMKKKSTKAQRRQSASASRKNAASRKAPRRWSAEVTRSSDALDLEQGVFTRNDPKQIAASLKRSAEASPRKKTDSFRSALSMLNFYINRAGTNLSEMRRSILTRAKDELRKQFGR
jgi:hypothetical protein